MEILLSLLAIIGVFFLIVVSTHFLENYQPYDELQQLNRLKGYKYGALAMLSTCLVALYPNQAWVERVGVSGLLILVMGAGGIVALNYFIFTDSYEPLNKFSKISALTYDLSMAFMFGFYLVDDLRYAYSDAASILLNGVLTLLFASTSLSLIYTYIRDKMESRGED